MKPYFAINHLIDMIDEPNRSIFFEMLAQNRKVFETAPGSSHNHHYWPGGYIDHIHEVMNMGVVLYRTMNELRSFSFSLSDLLTVLFLHDIEKPWKYEIKGCEMRYVKGMETKEEQIAFRLRLIDRHKVRLSDEQVNALEFAEGEITEHSTKKRCMGPLASVVHACDVLSARAWFDYPLESGDSWLGAQRFRTRA